MNTTGHDHDAREWEAQEYALRQTRAAALETPSVACGSGFSRELSPATKSASPQEVVDAAYRHVAEALRRPPPVDLPPDFAAHVARIAEMRAATPVAKSSRLKPLPQSDAFERALTRVLAAAFALGAVVVGLVYGMRVFAQLQVAIGEHGVQWAALLAGCLGLSWALDRLRSLVGHGDNDGRLA